MKAKTQYSIFSALVTCALLGLIEIPLANPALVPGVWTSITPASAPDPGANNWCGLDIDPSNSSIIYAGQLTSGVWKTTNGGESWTKPGTGVMGNPVTGIVDLPSCISVDPMNPLHLYTCHAGWGGTGSNLGFWISSNGGSTWTMTQGFIDASKLPGSSTDAAKFDVDPADFNHILVSMRYVADDQFGFLESTDGGNSFIHHLPPTTWEANTHGVHFLHNDGDPAWTQKSHTWHIDTEGHGWWRTTDAGATWTQVATSAGTDGLHGGSHNLYYSSKGTLYIGGFGYPSRSTDNGKSWKQITSAPYGYHGVMYGDGVNLYDCTSQGSNGGTVFSALETDDTKWGSPALIGWADQMRLDKVNRIVYMTGFATGVWALKLAPLTGTSVQSRSMAAGSKSVAPSASRLKAALYGKSASVVTASDVATGNRYNVAGRIQKSRAQ